MNPVALRTMATTFSGANLFFFGRGELRTRAGGGITLPFHSATTSSASKPFLHSSFEAHRFAHYCSFISRRVPWSRLRSYYRVGKLKTSASKPICCSLGKKSPTPRENSSSFCIIEGPEMHEDFVKMQLQELDDNIKSRRNKIFLLMEEVRRLRIQQRIKSAKSNNDSSDENEMPDMPSTIPFLPNMTQKMMKQLYLTSFSMIYVIIMFGGLLAPILELKLGLGGISYEDFIRDMHLPVQLSQVDPIVASFSGGAVGVISAIMLIEVNNVEQQQKKICKYCHGTGYLACARCAAGGICMSTGQVLVPDVYGHPLQPPTAKRCPNCSGAGKVMCPTCLCTGMLMASEHDPRIDPFD